MDYRQAISLLLLNFVSAQASSYNPILQPKVDKCETMTYSICRQMDYNRTIFPNYLGHRRQFEAKIGVDGLRPLLVVGCSPDALAFICSVYFPMCTSINKLVPPCRELCLTVHKDCIAVINRFGFSWPDELKCDRFPKIKSEVCIFRNETGVKPTLPSSFTLKTTRRRKGWCTYN